MTTDTTTLSAQLPYMAETIDVFDSLSASFDEDEPMSLKAEAGFNEPIILPPIGTVARLNGLDAGQRGPVAQFLQPFSSGSKKITRKSIKGVYTHYKTARAQLENYQDVVRIVTERDGELPDSDMRQMLLNYLLEGSCVTRLGDKIAVPTEDAPDRSLYLLLGIVRIVNEAVYNTKFANDLPWLADTNTAEAKRMKQFGLQAAKLGEEVGSALGRAASVAAVSLINPILKLPDEATIAISYIAGLQARKVAEIKMHRFLVANPNIR